MDAILEDPSLQHQLFHVLLMIDGILQPDGAAPIVEDQDQILKLQGLNEFPKDSGVLIKGVLPVLGFIGESETPEV